MVCAGINTAVDTCGFDPSVCCSVELPGAQWWSGCVGFCGGGWVWGSVLDLTSLGRVIFLVP